MCSVSDKCLLTSMCCWSKLYVWSISTVYFAKRNNICFLIEQYEFFILWRCVVHLKLWLCFPSFQTCVSIRPECARMLMVMPIWLINFDYPTNVCCKCGKYVLFDLTNIFDFAYLTIMCCLYNLFV